MPPIPTILGAMPPPTTAGNPLAAGAAPPSTTLAAGAPSTSVTACKEKWGAIHAGGVVALAFIPYIGPALAAVGAASTPLILDEICGTEVPPKDYASAAQGVGQAVDTYQQQQATQDSSTDSAVA